MCDPYLLNHAAMVVGYGQEVVTTKKDAVKFWIIKNSWGMDWGLFVSFQK